MRQHIIDVYGWHKCIYCDRSDVDLHVEHIIPRKRGGTNRLENLGLACQLCNNRKHDKPITEYLKADPERLRRILDHTTNSDIIKLDLIYRRTTSASTPICATGATEFSGSCCNVEKEDVGTSNILPEKIVRVLSRRRGFSVAQTISSIQIN